MAHRGRAFRALALAALLTVRAQADAGLGFMDDQLILGRLGSETMAASSVPAQAQFLDPASFAVMPDVPPPEKANGKTIFVPPGSTLESLKDRPFHVYHEDFLGIIGADPSLSLIAEEETDPLFHEAAVWYPPTDDMFFVQNAGARAAGTGLAKSAVVQKIGMREARAAAAEGARVAIEVVSSEPAILNPNGAANFKGNIIFAGEGMGDKPSALYLMNPEPPYNVTTLVNNFYGRQFNSLNDVAVHPRTGGVYFTDVTYGFLQDFRPNPGLPNQVYRFDLRTGAVTAVADEVSMCNGLAFSPDGRFAYVTSSAASQAFRGFDNTLPSSIYRYEVTTGGTFQHRVLFAYVGTGVPDGIHCDAEGNVYAGCGDGVYVWNPRGTLLGKIFTAGVVANFQFAGDGRIVILGETRLYYAQLGAKAAPVL
ncbi:Gluconolactonase [Escovopsis weberi]|uniref:Gluconolactonase n=1 Tax=Escovopsis weberi TaxID=150374 RepID=A0A0M8N1T1_ESCWE|nr:Gluconolactonase [Escovopsis weberi]